jgi:glyoxylase-like metal-dependent hydrolase (beta-lactamase superfamily II)
VIFEQLNEGVHKTYLVAEDEGGEAMLIDPLYQGVDGYLRHLEDLGLELASVVDTHTHSDHVTGCPPLAKKTGCDYVMHDLAPAQCVTRRLHHGEILTFGDLPIDVLATPGHAADGITLIVEGRLLTGDVLHIGSAGRSDLPGSDPDEHWHSLHRILQSLPDNTLFFPGHDYHGREFSSLGNERRHNPHFEHKDRYTYVRWQKDLRAAVPAWVSRVIEANFLCASPEEMDWKPQDAQKREDWSDVPPLIEGEDVPTEVEVIRLHDRIERGKNPILILDVRREDEYTGHLGHIEGSYHLPIEELDERIEEIVAFKQSEVIIVCRSGGRSLRAGVKLLGEGFEDVRSLTGGMIAWRSRGYRVDR